MSFYWKRICIVFSYYSGKYALPGRFQDEDNAVKCCAELKTYRHRNVCRFRVCLFGYHTDTIMFNCSIHIKWTGLHQTFGWLDSYANIQRARLWDLRSTLTHPQLSSTNSNLLWKDSSNLINKLVEHRSHVHQHGDKNLYDRFLFDLYGFRKVWRDYRYFPTGEDINCLLQRVPPIFTFR